MPTNKRQTGTRGGRRCVSVGRTERWYNGGMKTKTSVTLSPETLCEIDRAVGESGNRSAFIERVLAGYFREQRRSERDRHDAAIYARMAAEPDPENADLLDYLQDFSEFGDDIEVLADGVPRSEAR